MTDAAQLIVAEQRLPAAQLESDLAALDLLLHPDLTFVGPDGRLSDNAADLHVHRSAPCAWMFSSHKNLVARLADGVGVTVLTARLEGEYLGEPFAARMRYTRC